MPLPAGDLSPVPGSPSSARRQRRWTLRLVLAATIVAAAADLSREPADQVSTRAALAGIRLYQRTASGWMAGAGVACRFEPSCSRYAAVVIERDGALVGGLRSVGRIVRCGPWTPAGTVDEP